MSATSPNTTQQQQEAARFRSAVSEALLQSMQGNINYLLASILPVGSVIDSMLSESQFAGIVGANKWIIADGRDVSTSQYTVVTGFTSAPDLRGLFTRGASGARSTATGNSEGNKAVGTYEGDRFAAHVHSTHYRIPSAASGGSDGGGDTDRGLTDVTENSGSAGTGTETRVRSVTVNKFIRIN